MSQLGHCVQLTLANPTNGPQREVQLGQDLLGIYIGSCTVKYVNFKFSKPITKRWSN